MNASDTVKTQVPVEVSPLKADNTSSGNTVPDIPGLLPHTKATPESSNVATISFILALVHSLENNCTTVPEGLVNVAVKSFIQVCVIFIVIFTSAIEPPDGIVNDEVIVGVPDAEIVIGTLVEDVLAHEIVPVVNLYALP